MSHNAPPPADQTSAATSVAGAGVSLITCILAFFNESHIWLQNVTLLVSMGAGLIAIYAGIRRLLK